MSLNAVFDITGGALSSQLVRLNTIASNMANAETVAGSKDTVYKAKYPQFAEIIEGYNDDAFSGVEVTGIYESNEPPREEYRPGHPLANEKGYVFLPNVNLIEQMADMVSASRSYSADLEIFNTSKNLMQKTLNLGD